MTVQVRLFLMIGLQFLTESVSFPYEGGTEKREFVLGQGLDINQIASTLSNKGEDWLTALVENGKMTIVCERFAESQKFCIDIDV